LETSGELIRYGVGQTSIAAFLLALSDKGVVVILIQEHPGDEKLAAALRARFPRTELQHDHAGTREMVESAVNFVEDPCGNLALPLDIRGTDFQRRVWGAVSKIPFARTTTFLEIARAIGTPKAVRLSATPVLRTRSSSPFPAIACCGAMALTRVGPSGETGARRRLLSGRPAARANSNRRRKP
jgi:AraC family transcriptional regulator, regulatory protein of adaptative response / methylated-DNA-[protein]-cysteine methyltransferase